ADQGPLARQLAAPSHVEIPRKKSGAGPPAPFLIIPVGGRRTYSETGPTRQAADSRWSGSGLALFIRLSRRLVAFLDLLRVSLPAPPHERCIDERSGQAEHQDDIDEYPQPAAELIHFPAPVVAGRSCVRATRGQAIQFGGIGLSRSQIWRNRRRI